MTHGSIEQAADTKSSLTIMVVDDSPVNLMVLEDLLSLEGYRVLTFASGAEALEAAAGIRPDLILLDIMMPEMHGFELCRKLKADPGLREIPTIFISALDSLEDKIQAFGEGGVDYVTKPFQAEEVLARVSAHLEIRALQRRLQEQNANLERLVAQRTQALDAALAQLINLDRLKDSFLHMISHELCTPANGILGIGELLLEMCPESEDLQGYRDVFRHSGERLRNLIDDALMLANLDDRKLYLDAADALTCTLLLDELQRLHPELRIDRDARDAQDRLLLHANPRLLRKALDTALALVSCFSAPGTPMRMSTVTGKDEVRLRFDLNALALTERQAAEFFHLESQVRGASAAQTLALAPVVAQRILGAYGGDLILHTHEGRTGGLEARLCTNPR